MRIEMGLAVVQNGCRGRGSRRTRAYEGKNEGERGEGNATQVLSGQTMLPPHFRA